MHFTVHGAAHTAIVEVRPSYSFFNSSNFEIPNRGTEPLFSSGCMFEVIYIILESYGLLESIIDWKDLLEPSLSGHRHILFTLRGCVSLRLIRNPRSTNWGSFKEDLRD